jgi:hypothetical protein
LQVKLTLEAGRSLFTQALSKFQPQSGSVTSSALSEIKFFSSEFGGFDDHKYRTRTNIERGMSIIKPALFTAAAVIQTRAM